MKVPLHILEADKVTENTILLLLAAQSENRDQDKSMSSNLQQAKSDKVLCVNRVLSGDLAPRLY